jgi:hypothetical protein
LLCTYFSKAPADEPAQRREDEEIPRDGVVITRKAQFTRLDRWRLDSLDWPQQDRRQGRGRQRSTPRHSGAQRFGQFDKSLQEFSYSLGLNTVCTLQQEFLGLSNFFKRLLVKHSTASSRIVAAKTG